MRSRKRGIAFYALVASFAFGTSVVHADITLQTVTLTPPAFRPDQPLTITIQVQGGPKGSLPFEAHVAARKADSQGRIAWTDAVTGSVSQQESALRPGEQRTIRFVKPLTIDIGAGPQPPVVYVSGGVREADIHLEKAVAFDLSCPVSKTEDVCKYARRTASPDRLTEKAQR